MTSRNRRPRATAWTGLWTVILGASLVWAAEDTSVQAPAWPNLLSEAGRRAAMSLPKSSPYHLEPSLQDLEDAAAMQAAVPVTAKQRYDAHVAAATPNNVRANNPAGDATGETQSETAIAAFGQNIVVAWNDSRGFTAPNTVTSYAYSTDGGQTFTDGGNVPLALAGDSSFGDCTLDVDANGNFYMGVIYVSGGVQSVGVYRGNFVGPNFVWQNPVIASSGATGALDKCYLCVDRNTGDVYMSYTRFGATVTIEVVRGTVLGTVWSAAAILDNGTSGIQGSRPIVGPEGNLYVCWQSGWGFINCDLSNAAGQISFRRSVPAAAMTFGPIVSAGTVHMNWLSYWAGNLRSNALFFPDMAVDRSGGPNNGNVYVAWNESAPWTANAASGVSTAETESNDSAASASVLTLNPGDNATGSIATINDFDYWKLNVTAGQHIMIRLEPQGFNCGVTGTARNFQLRVFKGVAGTAGDSILCNSNIANFVSEAVFDANENATYLFRVRNVRTSGTTTGTYTVKTRLLTYGAPSPARDMRDVCVSRSTNQGASFTPEVRVNTSAANLDECIPAITVDGCGRVHALFYDVRDALGGKILRSYYDAVSTDGGLTYPANNRISNSLNYFNLNTIAVPNYGEYNQVCTNVVDPTKVHTVWSDERLANATTSGVDAYVALIQSCVSVGCPADTIMTDGSVGSRRFCVTNCGSVDETFAINLTDSQGWTSGAPASLAVPAGGTVCFDVTVTIPAATPGGTVSTIAFTATSASASCATATCTSHVTSETTVPVAVDALEATATDRGVALRWRLSADAVRDLRDVRVERADHAAGPFASVGAPLSPAADMAFEDGSAPAGRTYWYRLVLSGANGVAAYAGPVQVTTDLRGLRTALGATTEAADGRVQLRYSLGVSGAVKLEIYDVTGRRLRVVEQSQQGVGTHLVTWDRTSDAGSRVARGVYLVKFTAPQTSAASKIVLVHD